jgi:hypothetical protein
MRFHTISRSALAATFGMLITAGASLAAGGGMSISPGIVEHVANRGGVGSIKISNTAGTSMAVRVTLRPWLQARSGEVSPNRAATLGQVGVSPSSFTLGPGATRAVSLSLSRTPTQRSIYGAVEVTGLPSGRVSRALKIAYRLISSLRLDSPKNGQVFRAQPGGLVEQGSARHGTLLLAVRNTGNTIAPIGGTVSVSGQGRSLRATAGTKAIVPGQTVNVPLVELLGSLPAGRYTVTVGLTQGGRGIGTARRTIALR